MFKNRAEKEAFFKKFDEEQKRAGKIKQVKNNQDNPPSVVPEKKQEIKKPANDPAVVDYWSLVKGYQIVYKCSLKDAIRAVNKADLDGKKEAWIKKVNAERQAQNAPKVMHLTPDGRNWQQVMDQFVYEKGLSRIESIRRIDALFPGLRQAWIDEQNR